MPEDVISVLAVGSADLMGRSSISAECPVRRMHTNLGNARMQDTRRLHQPAKAPQVVRDVLARFACSQCDAISAPQIPRGVTVPQTVAPLRYLALDVKWLPGWEEDIRIPATHNTFTLASRLTRQKYSRVSIGSGHVRGVVRRWPKVQYRLDESWCDTSTGAGN